MYLRQYVRSCLLTVSCEVTALATSVTELYNIRRGLAESGLIGHFKFIGLRELRYEIPHSYTMNLKKTKLCLIYVYIGQHFVVSVSCQFCKVSRNTGIIPYAGVILKNDIKNNVLERTSKCRHSGGLHATSFSFAMSMVTSILGFYSCFSSGTKGRHIKKNICCDILMINYSTT